jgi:hypothetical protein
MAAADKLIEFGIYGAYDLGIHNFLKQVLTAIEPTIIILQSSPMRAFADAAAMLAKGTDDPGLLDKDLNRSANVPLPLVSVTPGTDEAGKPADRAHEKSLPHRSPRDRS